MGRRRVFGGDSRLVEAQLQFVERERAANGNRKLAVEHETLRVQSQERFDHVRKITGQRLTCFRLQENLGAVAKGNATKPVPFRFVLPFVADGNLVDRARFHRRKGRLKSELHELSSRGRRSAPQFAKAEIPTVRSLVVCATRDDSALVRTSSNSFRISSRLELRRAFSFSDGA